MTSAFGCAWLNLKMVSAVLAEMSEDLQNFRLRISENRNDALNSSTSPPPKKKSKNKTIIQGLARRGPFGTNLTTKDLKKCIVTMRTGVRWFRKVNSGIF
jgi:hypothetical protein